MIRLRKPLSYFQQKYGSWTYGLNKLYLMMEKQHNRGQEGAGLACLKMHAVKSLSSAKEPWVPVVSKLSLKMLKKSCKNTRWSKHKILTTSRIICPMPVKSIWGICATQQPERVVCHMCIRFWGDLIGVRRIFASAQTLIWLTCRRFSARLLPRGNIRVWCRIHIFFWSNWVID